MNAELRDRLETTALRERFQRNVEMLKELIHMMAADGELAETEKQLFATAAARMDISGDELNDIIDSIL